MTFNPYKQIGNGSIKELLVVGADPNSNYKFNMTSSNRDGVSPVSNVVEWGAQINVPQTYWVDAKIGIIRSTTLATPSQLPIGVWVCFTTQPPDAAWLSLRHYAINWQGASGGDDLLNTYPISLPALFGSALDAEASLTLFPIVSGTDIPTAFIAYKTQTELRLIKFELLLSGAKFTAIPLEPLSGGVLPDSLIVMDDGLLLLHGGGDWVARQPSSGLSGYEVGNDTSLSSSTASPYQQNSYPVSLAAVAGEGLTLRYLSTSPQVRYVAGAVVVSSVSTPSVTELTTPIKARMTPGGAVYWISKVGDGLGVIYAQATDVVTDVTGFADALLLGEDLLIYGKNDSPEVLSAPGTVNTAYPPDQPNIVNIHRMDLTRDTGFSEAGLGDIGPNALIIDPGAIWGVTAQPDAFDMKPVIGWVLHQLEGDLEPANFNGSLMALSDGSLVISSAVAAELIMSAQYVWVEVV